MSPRTVLTVGIQTLLAFPDEKVDGDEFRRSQFGRAGSGGLIYDVFGFDAISSLSVGIKWYARSVRVAPRVLAVSGPSRLETGESGTYRATVSGDASQPVAYRWDMGDGAVYSELEATHSFSEPGAYPVRFTATGPVGLAVDSVRTTVVAALVAPTILAASSSPGQTESGQPVEFRATASGSEPMTYRWTFGDGQTATSATATYRYDRVGTYSPTVTVRNAVGETSRSLTHVVVAPPDPCADVVELASVFFAFNSSVLSDEARGSLTDNSEVLRGCSSLSIRIEGYASPLERNPEALALARAQSVHTFYRDAGLPESALAVTSNGAAGGLATRKDDTSALRRVDSIVLR